MSTYSDKLKDPRWQKKRLEILTRDNFTCQWCQETTRTLHIHHLKYYGDPWEVADKFLLTLCETCHEDIDLDYKQAGQILIQSFKSKAFAAEHLIKLANAVDISDITGLPNEPNVDIIKMIFLDSDVFDFAEKKLNNHFQMVSNG